MTRRFFCTVLLFFSAASIGCMSFRATVMQHVGQRYFVKDTADKCVRGIPVRLKVPTHVVATIKEPYAILKVKNGVKAVTIPNQRRAVTTLVYTEKVFTVDFRRPAAGMLSLGGNGSSPTEDAIADDQYFKTLSAKFEEKTLEDITTSIGTLSKAGVFKSAAAPVRGTTIANDVLIDERDIAVERFDITECDWEEKLRKFVESHLSTNSTDPAAVYEGKTPPALAPTPFVPPAPKAGPPSTN